MKTIGIIAEFNPFHKGHEYLVNQARQCCDDARIVAVMSGSYTQRGEPASFNKHARAQAAVLCGVDLVLELPLPWCASRAEAFAYGGVYLLNALGCVDLLCYGTEQGTAEEQYRLAEWLLSGDFSARLKCYLARGMSFASARESAAEEALGAGAAKLLTEPNSTLGVEYCKALIKLQSNIQPFSILRAGAAHDSPDTHSGFVSAGYIRKSLDFSFTPAVARSIFEAAPPVNAQRWQDFALICLKRMSREELALLPDVGEGLENRIFKAARAANSLEELLTAVKTKRYSHARLRRIALASLLNIRAEDLNGSPPFLKPLAFNERGREILSQARKAMKSSPAIEERVRMINLLGEEMVKMINPPNLTSNI
ncbi:MAG: nucleotidyltransferase family protein [Oscillospiraceae bacterium]|nr:nucleotidyltransferase family protein [Oscillospiraceae bacterium]